MVVVEVMLDGKLGRSQKKRLGGTVGIVRMDREKAGQ